jgi:hypothetical protein
LSEEVRKFVEKAAVAAAVDVAAVVVPVDSCSA